ncbi:MAG: excinuclease ABC subunit UvrC [Lachnospiraceae bacterium]|nr:excinuclease ABC subunit UvrC [Lachnospiraceae bacterium]
MRVFNIEEELKKLPAKPGVYIMHDKNDAILYVGKAISLKNRVRQYFQSNRNLSPKIQKMVSKVARFEYIVVDSEMEALVLECNLIKEHRPKYNTMLKDDKHYPYIRVTVNEPFPRVMFARARGKDKAKYFGPYTSVQAVKDTLDLLKKTYQIRNCNLSLPKEKSARPCLYYHMGQCKAPCQGQVSREEYGKAIEQVLAFLGGNLSLITKRLEQLMKEASERLEFERAAEYRDLLNSVRRMAERQKADADLTVDRDIAAIATAGEEAVVQVFFVREGKMIGREHFYLTGVEGEERASVLQEFIKQFYGGTPHIPKELLLSEEIEERELLESYLSERSGRRVKILVPKKGEKERLVELAEKNASVVLQKDAEKIAAEEKKTKGAADEIAELLGLSELGRTESYDISNTAGYASVASMVVFDNGRPNKAEYRKFRIKTVQGPDDYASMREVLTRRFSHGLREREEGNEERFSKFPDLILMDGGKGQVNIAEEVLRELHINIPVCGMVKDDKHRTRGLYFHNEELPMNQHSEGFRLLTRIQDETHRFAIEYHRSLRGKEQVHSILDEIEGIGPTRRRALMKAFQSQEAIRAASEEELAAVPSMNVAAAHAVYTFFKKKSE